MRKAMRDRRGHASHLLLLIDAELLPQRLWQTHWLRAHAEISPRNPAAAQQLVDHPVHGGRRDRELPVP